METNMIQFTLLPNRSDIVVWDVVEQCEKYIDHNGFVKAELDEARYKVKGVVYHRRGKEVRWVKVLPNYQAKQMVKDCTFKVNNISTEVGEKVLSYKTCVKADNYATPIVMDIPYSGTTLEAIAEEINAFFVSQNMHLEENNSYKAIVKDGALYIVCLWKTWNQYAYTQFVKNDSNPNVSAIWSCADGIKWHNTPSKNGWYSYIWCANKAKTIAYRKTQAIQLKAPITSINREGLGLLDYLSENCEAIRAIFGEGEEGWLNYMETCKAETTSMRGGFAEECGLELTKQWCSYKSLLNEEQSISPAAEYVQSLEDYGNPQGSFYLPSAKELCWLVDGIEYPINEKGENTSKNRAADELNEVLEKLGKAAIGNNSALWSCSRSSVSYGWLFNGGYGNVGGGHFCYAFSALPVTLSLIP